MLIDQAPIAVAILTGLAVNLRMAIYSGPRPCPTWQGWRCGGCWRPYLMVDQVYALSVQRFMASSETPGERLAYYLGCAAPVVPFVVSGQLGWCREPVSASPCALALDFAVPITFIAMVAPMLMTAPAVVSAIVAVAVSLLISVNLPFDLGIIVGGLAGTAARRGLRRAVARGRATVSAPSGRALDDDHAHWRRRSQCFLVLALLDERPLPAWALRALRYVPTSVLPALVAPMVVWPDATGGAADLPRALAAVTALAVGVVVRNVLAAIGAGLAVLYVLLALGF